MPFLKREKAEIYYETLGQTGSHITLINGHTRSSRDFRLISKTLVGMGYQTLCFDNRGSGFTKDTDDFTIEDMIGDVLALWDHLHIQKSHVVGISMGGILAQILAATYPSRVDHLILVSTTSDIRRLTNFDAGPWGSDTKEIEKRLMNYVTKDFYERNKLLIQAMAKQIQTNVLQENFDIRAQAQRQAIHNLNVKTMSSQIQAPTLVIHGLMDEIIPVDAAYDLHRDLINSKLVIKNECGHLLLAECSKELLAEIQNFIG